MFRHQIAYVSKAKGMGFTLVELSIVLVIIGLLAAGVLVGRDLLKTAQYNKVISEVERFKVAIYTFQGKYQYLPGDLPNASSLWTGCVAEPGWPGNACNGNGNGTIEYVLCCEAIRAWQHMSLAGMLEYYNGYYVATGYMRGRNVPPSVINERAYYFMYANFLPEIYPVTFRLGGTDALSEAGLGIMTGKDAHKIDRKIDDGLPNYNETTFASSPGSVAGFTGTKPDGNDYTVNSTKCTVVPVTTPPTYNLSTNELSCVLAFNMK